MTDFFEIWLQSALNERKEAQHLRRMARGSLSWGDILKRRASEAFNRAMFDLSEARRRRSNAHAN